MVNLLGWIGASLILLSYISVSAKKISPHSQNYHLLNLLGAVGITINSLSSNAFPIAILNIIWALIAAYKLIK